MQILNLNLHFVMQVTPPWATAMVFLALYRPQMEATSPTGESETW